MQASAVHGMSGLEDCIPGWRKSKSAGMVGLEIALSLGTMQRSRTITLFSEPPRTQRGPSAVMISIVFHVLVIGVFYFAITHEVRVEDAAPDRYTVRLLNLHQQSPQPRRVAGASGGARGGSLRAPRPSQAADSSGRAPAAPSLPVELARTIPAPQTLVQPDLPPNLLLPKETPIPMVLLWSPQNDPVKEIVPPPPQVPTTANVRPSLETPNRELDLADLKISASVFVTTFPSLPPSTTTPLVVRGPAPVAQAPATASKPVSEPTPARVMSLSDLQLQEGPVTLPMVNETAAPGSSMSLLPGKPELTAGTSAGKPTANRDGNGAKTGAGESGERAVAGGSGAQAGGQAGPGSGTETGLDTASGGAAGLASGSSNEPSLTRIDLPKDGQFGVVVVGSSPADQYPEISGIWSGRLAYTVYLHVGLAKSWVLQYSLPRNAEASAAGQGVRPEAPWPYLMELPHLAQGDSDSDAIMVHGFVNMTGRFEQLAVVFPPAFPQAKFVLDALQQWQFRPALENGKMAAVEILLIIPDQED